MRILITGSSGMLGRDMVHVLGSRHHVIPLDRRGADIADSHCTFRALSDADPEVVVHAAAFTAVDECERNPKTAFQVNGEGTRNVATTCRRLGIPMLYVSTDYIFDGEKPSAYVETDEPNPLNAYGRSKLEGERHVAELLTEFWIVRVSWLFGPLGKNFVEAILRQARERNPLKVVDDQVGSPTYTVDLSAKIEEIIERGDPGIYHVTNQGYCSWFEFAQEILRQAGLTNVALAPISTSEAARRAARPRSSRLANARLKAQGFDLLPAWQEALARYLVREGQKP